MEDKIIYGCARVQQIVLSLQMEHLRAKEQLQKLREFQRVHDGQFTPDANDYLCEEIKALSDFCNRKRRLRRKEKSDVSNT